LPLFIFNPNLGSADSGKSTIAKQMRWICLKNALISVILRILHANGFNETELVNYRYMVLTNMVTAYHYMCKGALELQLPVKDEEKVGC
jgi:hypothetical protein